MLLESQTNTPDEESGFITIFALQPHEGSSKDSYWSGMTQQKFPGVRVAHASTNPHDSKASSNEMPDVAASVENELQELDESLSDMTSMLLDESDDDAFDFEGGFENPLDDEPEPEPILPSDDQSEGESEPESEPEPISESESASEPEPESEPEAETESEAENAPESVPNASSEAEAVSEAEAEDEAEAGVPDESAAIVADAMAAAAADIEADQAIQTDADAVAKTDIQTDADTNVVADTATDADAGGASESQAADPEPEVVAHAESAEEQVSVAEVAEAETIAAKPEPEVPDPAKAASAPSEEADTAAQAVPDKAAKASKWRELRGRVMALAQRVGGGLGERSANLIALGLEPLAARFEFQPKVVRHSIAWLAMVTAFNAVAVWGFVLFFRSPTGGANGAQPNQISLAESQTGENPVSDTGQGLAVQSATGSAVGAEKTK